MLHLLFVSIALCLTSCACIFLVAADSGISLITARTISSDATRIPHVESFLAINPKDPSNLLTTSITVEGGKAHTVLYVSQDSGKTWTRPRLGEESKELEDGGDPVVYFDGGGVGYWATVASGFHLVRSLDKGKTWSAPLTVPGGAYDRPYLAFDSTGGRFHGRAYAAGVITVQELGGNERSAIALARSMDGGKTFTSPKILVGNSGSDPASGSVLGPTDRVFGIIDLIVTPDGHLVLPFETVTASGPNQQFATKRIWFLRSEDGGRTFSKPVLVARRQTARGFRYWKGDSCTRAAIDSSKGPFHGRIYIAFMDATETRYDVKLVYSDDGRSWSKPVLVNDNENAADNANAAVAVNRNGVVAMIWNDRRGDPRNICFEVRVGVSLDGGESFLSGGKLPGRTCPNAPGNWELEAGSYASPETGRTSAQTVYMFGAPVRWPNGGDTQGLIADADGVFHAAYVNGESGVMQLWHGTFSANGKPSNAHGRQLRDRTAELKIEASKPSLDLGSRTMSVEIRIRNAQPDSMAGPFMLVLERIGSSLKGVRVENADNGEPGKGAAWIFSEAILQPKAVSGARTIRWTFEHMPAELDDYPAEMGFRVLSDLPKQQR